MTNRPWIRARPLPWSLLAAAAAALGGCVAGAPDGAVRPRPPAPLPEWKTGPATPGLVWFPGTWQGDGVAYVWVPGHGESPPPLASGR